MNEKEIEKLIKKFDRSKLQEMTVDQDGTKIYFSKVKGQSRPNVEVSNSAKPVEKKTDDYELKAPMVGILYFSPTPKKPAYKKIGDHVKKGETVAIIEAMKMVNEIKSPVSGTIEKRLVDNGSMVDYHEPLFLIKED